MMNVSSPCIGICRINVKSGLCEGCYRTVEEISGWIRMPEDDRRQVIQLVEQRQSQASQFD